MHVHDPRQIDLCIGDKLAKEPSDICSIVALHGLGGHAWNSFTTSTIVNHNAGRTKETNWLRDIMPRLLEQNQQQHIYPRVMTYGYNADVWMTKSATEIDVPVDNLLSYLATERENVKHYEMQKM